MTSGVETEPVRTINGHLFGAPVEGQLGMRLVELSAGRSLARVPIPWAEGPAGLALARTVLVDTAGGVALAAYRGRGHGGPTIELRLDHVAPPAPHASALVAEARVRHEVGGAAFLSGEIRDDTGGVVAVASGHFLLLSRGAKFDPERVRRPERGADGALFRALRPAEGDPGRWPLRAERALANGRGDVHGGVLLAIGEVAQRRFQAGEAGELLPLRVAADYLRPVPADGGELLCRTEYVRRGRTVRTLRSELVRSDGQVATVINGAWVIN